MRATPSSLPGLVVVPPDEVERVLHVGAAPEQPARAPAWYSPHTGSWACAYPLAEDARPSGMNRNHLEGRLRVGPVARLVAHEGHEHVHRRAPFLRPSRGHGRTSRDAARAPRKYPPARLGGVEAHPVRRAWRRTRRERCRTTAQERRPAVLIEHHRCSLWPFGTLGRRQRTCAHPTLAWAARRCRAEETPRQSALRQIPDQDDLGKNLVLAQRHQAEDFAILAPSR